MKRIVVFSGAGISAESGIKTFRDSGGLWEQHNISEVATPEAWMQNPKLVLEFYNMRRRQVLEAEPNTAHKAIAALESHFEVHVITQNIDDLHERAGSSRVLHLHGEILKVRSTGNSNTTFDHRSDLALGDCCPEGYQLRPHVVWFGESVPNIPMASKIVSKADIFVVVGTSLNVYPAAGLAYAAPKHADIYVVDPSELNQTIRGKVIQIKAPATEGIPILARQFMEETSRIT